MWENKARTELAELPYHLKILDKVELYLAQNPIILGKPLKGEYKHLYRYRFGNYIYSVSIEKSIVTVIKIGHRANIY
ncbi:MAG TPA: type II toxin-antitoxin system RelE/ParE family toxin [Rickettsia endosymbiont of Ceroptres masudai]|nr:type II toxin-antitoxin system RelE/ParE family toxin [Rickettsia endosymbiont of Ceroptres masudai]